MGCHIINMLKEFFARVKSEKSQSGSSTQPQQLNAASESLVPYDHTSNIYQSYPLPALKLVPTIPRIQYAVLKGFPDIRNAIVSCGIKFHELPYAGRRVKQIYTRDNLPEYAQYLLSALKDHLHKPNHFLINDYPAGVGIMSHVDGPAYYPKVVVYSIGTAIIKFTKDKEQHRLLLEDKSLYVFEGEAYTSYLHGVADHGVDCIFFKVQGGQITNSSVDNFMQTSIYQQVVQLLRQTSCLDPQQIGDYEISRVEGNQEYSHVLSVERTRRISVTIRHKYL